MVMGNTRAEAAVFGPREPEGGRAGPGLGTARVELSFLPFAGSERRRRGRGDRRTGELAAVLAQVVESVVMLELLARSEVCVCVSVVQDDGGALPAAINAAVLALAEAGVPMRALVAACAAGTLEGEPALDLNRTEETAAGRGLAAAVSSHDGRVLALHSEEECSVETLGDLMRSASSGCDAVSTFMRGELEARVALQAERLGMATKTAGS
jgi:exosome complex component RRP41